MDCYVDSHGSVREYRSNERVVTLFMVMSPSAIFHHVYHGWLCRSAVKRVSYQRGYVSRRQFHCLGAPLYYSRRLKLFYILVPCWDTTRYCRRFYLDSAIFDPSFSFDSVSLR